MDLGQGLCQRMNRNPSLDGLKGMGVLLLFFMDYGRYFAPLPSTSAWSAGLAQYLAVIGEAGLGLLFVITGVLTYPRVIGPSFGLWRFLAERAQRVYPAFLLVLIICGMAAIALPDATHLRPGFSGATALAANALLLHGVFAIPAVIPGTEGLGYGFLMCLALPLLMGGLRLRAASHRTRVHVLGAIASLVLMLSFSEVHRLWLLFFVVGFIVAEGSSTALPDGRRRWSGALALAIGLPLTYVFSRDVWLSKLWLCAVLFILTRAVLDPRTHLARILAMRPMRWLGAQSFSWYLVHALTLKLMALALAAMGMARWLRTESGFWALAPLALAATLLVGRVLYLAVERRFSNPTPTSPLQYAVPETVRG